ncbi:PI-PLC X domain-containing protein 1-like [Oppia nitens]|uniref:PI-PLC X domain-containing protein 1-like n=1 Tax=Oppia nitens TaxID=1686743 RepID=UPI0023D9D5F1|nr:PI-PLC X domain-containing protein 1-like [Oppia nitens]
MNLRQIVSKLIISVIIGSTIDCSISDTNDKDPEVWITVSSLADFNRKLNRTIERQIELNWRRVTIDGQHNQWIGLFNENPSNEKLVKSGKNYSIDSINIDLLNNGSYRTYIQFPYKKFSMKNLNNSCLKYWIALIKNKKIIAKNCLKIHPFWMEKNMAIIGNMSLLDLMIPGTHNSGSFDRYDLYEDTLTNKYTLCQDESIFNQLIYGIRFLDLRIAYDNNNEDKQRVWIVHGPVVMKHTLNSVIQQIKRFMEMAPKEVIIIDFHRFEKGFAKDELSQQKIRRHHRKVWTILDKHLLKYLVPKSMGLRTKLNELIAKNKRIIIGYTSDNYLIDRQYLFPQTKHLWPNTDIVNEMVDYFNKTICDVFPGELVSSMAQLTAEKFKLIIDLYDGLRTMAQNVNRLITDAFHWDSGMGWTDCANVVSSDYFLGNNLIDISIKTNLMRSKKQSTVK